MLTMRSDGFVQRPYLRCRDPILVVPASGASLLAKERCDGIACARATCDQRDAQEGSAYRGDQEMVLESSIWP